MKKFFTLAMVTAMILFFFSCKKSSSDNSNTTTTSFSMKYNGTAWTGTTITASYISYNNSTSVTAYKSGTSDQVVIAFTGNTTGTYNFTGDAAIGSGTIGSVTFSSLYSAVPSGTITVTNYDTSKKLISGTFSFDAVNTGNVTVHITEGKFENIPVTIY